VHPVNDAVQIGSEHFIAARSSRADDRTRVLKSGDSFAVFDRHGEIGPLGLGEHGLYCRGARHLSRWELTLSGYRLLLLNSAVKQDNSLLVVDQTAPDIRKDDRPCIPKDVLHLRRELSVQGLVLSERLRVTNYHDRELSFDLQLDFAADFRDVFEVRGVPRERRGELLPPQVNGESVVLGYRGLDDVLRRTRVEFSQVPSAISGESARFEVHLDPGEGYTLETRVACTTGEAHFCAGRHAAGVEASVSGVEAYAPPTRVYTDNQQFNAWLERSAADLQMLTTDTCFGPYPYAGVPWFATPFGRDGLIAALQTLWIHPHMARGVLRFLAATQADGEDPACEAEPGKIAHELREGEMAALGEVPFRRYYGTADATPLFVILAGRYYQRTADRPFIEALWPHVERAMDWIETHGDIDRDGFVEYARHGEAGLVQQGWKDSDDSVFHADGRDAPPPIALCEVQAYVYEAYGLAAELAEVLGHGARVAEWRARRDALKDAFDRAFWVEAIGTYALALDGAKRPCAVRTSNAAHALYCGIARPERAVRIAQGLLGPEGFNGWGVRTVFAGEARYNPMSYHNGSVWPHDTALAAAGLVRYGLRGQAMKLMTGLFDAALFLDQYRLPELFCGFQRLPAQAPTLYPVACIPQAWASGAMFMLLQASLGIRFSPQPPHVLFHRPHLPDYIGRMWIEGLRYGDMSVDLTLRRRGSDVAIVTEGRRGGMEVALIV
jgi:glycogen debranching enzyme